jgi:hypothetical protein
MWASLLYEDQVTAFCPDAKAVTLQMGKLLSGVRVKNDYVAETPGSVAVGTGERGASTGAASPVEIPSSRYERD